jgi:hypothetical protein
MPARSRARLAETSSCAGAADATVTYLFEPFKNAVACNHHCMWSTSIGPECPECGLRVLAHYMAAGLHECRLENVIEQQVKRGRVELDRELGDYLVSPEALNRLAFARWCRSTPRECVALAPVT